MSAEPIYRDNSYLLEFAIQHRDPATGKPVATTGLVDLVGLVAATQEGTAINPALSLTLAERSGKPGTYYGVIGKAAVNAHLFDGATNYDGQTVWLSARNNDIDVTVPTKAKSSRKIT